MTSRLGVVRRRSLSLLLVVGVSIVGAGVSGCSVVAAVKHATSALRQNKATIDAFTRQMSPNQTTFEVTYTVTGTSPLTVTYAVAPPRGLTFREAPSAGASTSGGASRVDLVVNASGEYYCTSPPTPWSCRNSIPPPPRCATNCTASTRRRTGSVLQGLTVVASFAGDKVTTSSMTVNGFALRCVDFQASGVPGTSTICTSTQGILGYVKVAGGAPSFEVTSYATTPAPSLFQLPPGAVVTTLTTTT